MASLVVRIAICTLLLMQLASAPATAFAQGITERDRNAVEAAWKKNEKMIATARFSWEEERVEVKGAAKKEPLLPADDLIWVLDKKYTLMDDKMDYYVTIRSRNNKKPVEIQRLNEWCLFDGEKGMEFIPPLDGHPNEHPHGAIHSSKNWVVSETTALPFLWACRMSMAGEKALLKGKANYDRDGNGNPVIVFRNESGNARAYVSNEIWVNPAEAYSIMKYIMKQDDNVLLDFNVSYLHDEKNDMWIPKTWHYVFPGLVSGTGMLSEYALNPTIGPGEFVREFPVGTQVATDEGRYIVRENGSKRIIEPEEYVAPYETLLQTERGMALKEDTSWRRHMAIASILIAISFFVLRIFLRQRRSQVYRPGRRG